MNINDMTPNQLADHLGELKSKQAALAKEAKEVQAKLRPCLLGGKTVLGDYFQITLSEGDSERLDATSLKKELPDLCAKYMKTSHFTRFNVNARSEA